MRLLAPAKVNLHLRVGPRREDGFHPLLSWMTTVGLFDSLVLEEERAAQTPTDVVLQCDLPALPCDERNLVVKVARAWMEVAQSEINAPKNGAGLEAPSSSRARATAGPVRVRGIRATLQKRIPLGAGLGGGSSDAARTLLALNRLWKTGRAADDLSAFAARFGSDLPFFFFGPSSICSGRGEIVRPVPRPRARWAALVTPAFSMPTVDVYRRFDQMGLGRMQDLVDGPDWYQWTHLGSEDLLPRLVNDLEPAAWAIAPQLGALRQEIERLLGRVVRMSGSGSSLFTLFDFEPQARDASARIERDLRQRALPVEVAPIFVDDLNEPNGDT